MALTLRFSKDLVDGLKEVLCMAERGRSDFGYQAQFGDYSEQDKKIADEKWKKAKDAITSIRTQLDTLTEDPIFDAVEKFTEVTRYWVEDDIWQKTSCKEAESSADLFRIMGKTEDASWVIRTHAQSDTDEEDAHHYIYMELQAEKLVKVQDG